MDDKKAAHRDILRVTIEPVDDNGRSIGKRVSLNDLFDGTSIQTILALIIRDQPPQSILAKTLEHVRLILSIYADDRSEQIRFQAIRDTLKKRAKKNSDDLAGDAHSAVEVDHQLVPFLKRLLVRIVAAAEPSAQEYTLQSFASVAVRMGEAFAEECSQTGAFGAKTALAIQEELKKRTATFDHASSAPDLCYLWFPHLGKNSKGDWEIKSAPPVFMSIAITCLWIDVVRQSVSTPTFRIAQVMQGDDSYAKLPKIASPISWAMGAPGVVANIDGEIYAQEPSIAPKIPNLTGKLVPRSWALLPKGHERRPHQTILPLQLMEEPEALAVMVAQAQGYVITPQASKLALYWFASPEIRAGGIARATLRDLAVGTLGESVKRIQQREIEETARALEELDWLHVYLPDETKFRIFSVRRPWTPAHAKPDMEVFFGMDPHFVEILKNGVRGERLHGNEYDGDFLINLTGMMQLPNKRPALLRHYVRAAAHWNAYFVPGKPGVFDCTRLPFYDLREWASMTNCLPLAVVEYLMADPAKRKTLARSRRVSASQTIAGVRAELEELHDRKLVVIEKHGDEYRMVPPRTYLTAKELVLTEGVRPKK